VSSITLVEWVVAITFLTANTSWMVGYQLIMFLRSRRSFFVLCCVTIIDKWYHFNDSSVTPTDPSRIKGPSAYLLFYRQKPAAPAAPASNPTTKQASSAAASASSKATVHEVA
jgi:hypothetical protein